jgi:hypothetical protein
MVLGSATIAAWLRLRAGSVWPCAIYHASHNLFIQSLFTPFTEVRSGNPVWMQTRWWIDEFGAMLAITSGLTALIILVRYRSRDDTARDRVGRSSATSVA